jgi:imidazole glycerol phosphate synthase glutamine amidotransferase subunit
MIGVIDYDRGNLRSVTKALEAIGAPVRLVSAPHELAECTALVLPGVGSFGDAASTLNARGLWEPIREWIAADRPFLGICLGYQLLFEGSEESPGVPGLGAFAGQVVRFPSLPGVKVPHMGWNQITPGPAGGALWSRIPDGASVYFVHSFYPLPADASLSSASCNYAGLDFAAAIQRGNLMATQFHPEKSQGTGLAILRGFVEKLAALPLAAAA